MSEETPQATPPTPRPRRSWLRRAGVAVLAVALVAGGYVVGRTDDARSSTTAASSASPSPSSSRSSTPEPSPARSSRSDGVETCDRLQRHVRPLFAFKIGGETVTPDLVTRHQVLDADRTGCRWEDEGKSLSLIAGPEPIARPWIVVDRAWDDPAPWGCDAEGGNRVCGSSMWETNTGAGVLAAWSYESRQCIAASNGLDLDRGEFPLWGLCAGWLTGKWS